MDKSFDSLAHQLLQIIQSTAVARFATRCSQVEHAPFEAEEKLQSNMRAVHAHCLPN
jgi:hypothetical protein